MHEELCKRIKDNVHFIAKNCLYIWIVMSLYHSLSKCYLLTICHAKCVKMIKSKYLYIQIQ